MRASCQWQGVEVGLQPPSYLLTLHILSSLRTRVSGHGVNITKYSYEHETS